MSAADCTATLLGARSRDSGTGCVVLRGRRWRTFGFLLMKASAARS